MIYIYPNIFDLQPLKLRFKMAAKCVLVLIRWLNAIIDISDTKTIRTATEERWYTLYTSQEARRLAFNKMVYSKERVNISIRVTITYILILIK